MKKTIFFSLFLTFVLALHMGADAAQRRVPRTSADLKKKELRQIAIDFYAVKCGLSKESLSKASMDIQLLQDGHKVKKANGHIGWKNTSEPYWQIHIRSIPETEGIHQGFHLMCLTRQGKLLSWRAHGGE